MHRPLLALLIGLSACSQPVSKSTQSPHDLTVPTNSCEASSQAVCAFFNAPLILLTTPIRLFLRKENFYPMAHELEFVDSSHKKWTAPKGTLTDGASIPPVFVPMVGAPTSKEFVNAAAIHDAYCGVGNDELAQYHSDTWQNVHRMFYDALRVGGTPPKKAKIMFAAVYIGGPRWTLARARQSTPQVGKSQHLPDLQFSTKTSNEPQRSENGRSLRQKGISDSRLQRELAAAIEFINTQNPSIAALERHLIERDEVLDRVANQSHSPGGAPASPVGPVSPGGPSSPVGPVSPVGPSLP